MARGDLRDARCLHVDVNRLRNGIGHAWNREGGKGGVRMIGWERAHRREPLGHRVGDFARVPACPDARAVDAPATAVGEHAVDHQVEMLLPLIDLLVTEQNLRDSGTVPPYS